MADTGLRQSALAHLHLAARAVAEAPDAGVRMRERPFRTMLDLRGRATDPAFLAATAGALGFDLPLEANTAVAGGDLGALWLGPDEWLVVAPPGRETGIAEALAGHLAAVTDVGHARTVIEISGPRAREVLMKGCSLDLHPRVFGPGRCAQSALARAQVLLHQTDDGPTFELYVQRSFADYLWAWLEDAATEYGLAVIEG